MSRREPCRYFLRGSCRFGDNCRYLHVSPNQNQNQTPTEPSTNPFEFGASQFSQKQQQKPNPIGHGEQNKTSTSQFMALSKTFENKWIRSTSTGSKQTDSQTLGSVHTCTDPESCRNIISDDFMNEAPLWKLTCYAHYKDLPCDIHGDISSEELRALAYEEAKQGRNLQSIVERERNLLQSKLSEFDNLLCKPYLPPNISPEELRALAYEEAKQGHNLQSIVERERNLLQSKLSEFDNMLHKSYLPPNISPEELRALAYEEAKQGHNLQSIVERERNLLQSKLSEFDNLLHKPYLPPNSNLGPTSQNTRSTPIDVL